MTKPQKILLYEIASGGVLLHIKARQSVTARVLMDRGLIVCDNGWKLTDAGREAITETAMSGRTDGA